MGIIMFEAYFRHGGINAADYPKYIIPYTPICFSLIICVALLPFIYKLKKIAFPFISILGLGFFLIIERFFEKMVVFNNIYGESQIKEQTERVETWQWYMCVAPPSLSVESCDVATVNNNPWISEYSPAFKIHFYAIAIIIILIVRAVP
jgi:hypothetical protein